MRLRSKLPVSPPGKARRSEGRAAAQEFETPNEHLPGDDPVSADFRIAARPAADLNPPVEHMEFTVKVIGHVESPLQTKADAPKQGEEGSPLAVLVFHSEVQEALSNVSVGDRLLLLTWLDQADRAVLKVHPRDDRALPLCGVFSTRSQDRPNPIGVHRVTIVSILDPLRFQVRDLEAFDRTPIIDVKATLEGRVE